MPDRIQLNDDGTLDDLHIAGPIESVQVEDMGDGEWAVLIDTPTGLVTAHVGCGGRVEDERRAVWPMLEGPEGAFKAIRRILAHLRGWTPDSVHFQLDAVQIELAEAERLIREETE